jgi:hypothetical protein
MANDNREREMRFSLCGCIIFVAWALFCSAALPAGHEISTKRALQMEQPEKKSVLNISLPPIDEIVPDKIETATFALG